MRRRVVITGIGCVTPLGSSVEEMWRRVLRGDSEVGPITLFDASNFPTKIASEVRNWDISQAGEIKSDWEKSGRHTRFAVGAAKQAMQSSGLNVDKLDPVRFGVYLGSGEGQQDFDRFSKIMVASIEGDQFDIARFIKAGLEILDPIAEVEQEPNMPAAHLAALFNAQGPNLNCLTACAASSQAIGESVEIIRRGDADVMLSGGTHSMIHPFGVTGFNLLTALSVNNAEPSKASRPFDRTRDGFVIGEGSSMLLLEELDHAKARGATILAEILGYGSTADAYRVTDAHPEGRGAAACLKMAIDDAGVNNEQIQYINAHGTSTQVNDKVETLAMKMVFGELAYKIPVSSTKSMLGHLIAAAGATELIISMLAIRDNVLPPTINYETPDPECDLDYIPNHARQARCDVAASNSFGFGGQNVSLVVGRFKG